MFWVSNLKSPIGFGNTKNPMKSFALLVLPCRILAAGTLISGGSDHILAVF